MNIAAYGFAIWETFYVTVLSTAFALVLGLPLGVLLVAGDKDGILPLPGWLMHLINGGGGLGKIALSYGYYRYQTNIMIVCVVLLVLMVQAFQSVGTLWATKSDKRLRK